MRYTVHRGVRCLGTLALVTTLALAGCSKSEHDKTTGGSSTVTTSASDALIFPRTAMGASTTPGTGSTLQTLSVGGKNSAYVLHAPTGLDGKAPTVIVLHGANGNGQQIEQVTGFSALADTENFLVAYPDQTDIDGVEALIAELTADHNADPTRIYVTGISRGGAASQVIACQLADKVAAIAALSSGLPTKQQKDCNPAKPLPVMLIHGTDDPIVSFDGGQPNTPNAEKFGYTVLSEPATLAFWRGKDGCTDDTTTAEVPDTDATVTRTSGPACADGTRVELYTVRGGGHTWPGGTSSQTQYAATLGPLNTKFDATQAIWDFFSAR